jgi:hypothetical protein
MDDGKQVAEAVARQAMTDALKKDDGQGHEKKTPAGCVERVLNYRDRNLLVGACRAFCSKDGHKGFKDQAKLDKVSKIVLFDETLDYFDMIDESLEDETRRWQRAKTRHKMWKDHKAGLVKAEDVKRLFPDADPDAEPEKPSFRQPVTGPKESRGDERPFHFPSKVDAWIQDALKAMEWSPFAAEYAVELCSKFGLSPDE